MTPYAHTCPHIRIHTCTRASWLPVRMNWAKFVARPVLRAETPRQACKPCAWRRGDENV